MSQRLKIESLQAESAAVTALLQEAEKWNDPVGKIQFLNKKRLIDQQLSALISNPEKRASIVLYFGGGPVHGSRGISMDFAGATLEKFQELVTRSYAHVELGAIGERGPVPLQDASRLMVTNVGRGSFGFVLEELDNQEEIADTPLKNVVENVASLLEKTASPNSIAFEEVVENLDARTLSSLKDFFTNLDKREATFRLLEEKFDFTLDHVSISRARMRTESTQIEEEEQIIIGTLEGFLPEHKKFEMRFDGESIYGSATKQAVEQLTQYAQNGDKILNKKWEVKVIKKVITPLNKSARKIYRLTDVIKLID